MNIHKREVRKVPENWVHPTDVKGNFIPLWDDTFDAAYKHWADGLKKWIAGSSLPQGEWEATVRSYILFEGVCPDANNFADYKGQKRSHYVLYEIRSDGTPLTPAFESLDKLKDYMVSTGSKLDGKYSAEVAARICNACEPARKYDEQSLLKKVKELARLLKSATKEIKKRHL